MTKRSGNRRLTETSSTQGVARSLRSTSAMLTAREFSPSFRPPYCRTISRESLTFPATSICRVAKKSLVVALPYSQRDPAHTPVTAATSPASSSRTQKKRCTRPPRSLLHKANGRFSFTGLARLRVLGREVVLRLGAAFALPPYERVLRRFFFSENVTARS